MDDGPAGTRSRARGPAARCLRGGRGRREARGGPNRARGDQVLRSVPNDPAATSLASGAERGKQRAGVERRRGLDLSVGAGSDGADRHGSVRRQLAEHQRCHQRHVGEDDDRRIGCALSTRSSPACTDVLDSPRGALVERGRDRETLDRGRYALGLESEHDDDRSEPGFERWVFLRPLVPPVLIELDEKLVAAEAGRRPGPSTSAATRPRDAPTQLSTLGNCFIISRVPSGASCPWRPAQSR